jgi:hypothetical protein
VRATTAEYVFTQEWMQFRENFTATALNTPHPSAGMTPDYSTFFLVSEGPRQDVGGGVVKWQRTYAIVPASYDEFESYSYNFIGYSGLVQTAAGFSPGAVIAGRPRACRVVTCRVHNDYFKTGPGATFAVPKAIPTVGALRYYASDPVLGNTVGVGTTLESFETDFLADAAGPLPASVPSKAIYTGWVATGAEIVAEDSRLTRWMGNIFNRQTRYVVAQ